MPLDLLDGRASANQRRLRHKGLAGWQWETTAALLSAFELTAKPGTFLDVGANAGVYAILCRLLWPQINAIAFEPTPATARAGIRWASANDVDVAFEQLALSDDEGPALLHLSDRSDASNSLVAGFRESSEAVEVETTTLDDYVESRDIVPTVIKVDVEQHELSVVRGAKRTLQRHEPVIVMELLKAPQSRKAHRLLQDLGYEPDTVDTRDCVYWPGTFPTRWDEVFQGWLAAVERCRPMIPRKGLKAIFGR